MSATESGPDVGLADTSLFIATEQDRPLSGQPPERVAISVITLAELELGVLAAPDDAVRSARLRTLNRAESFEPFVIDRDVGGAWAALRLALGNAGRRMPLNDSWIAATALAHGMPVVTQDDDYDGVPGLEVIRL